MFFVLPTFVQYWNCSQQHILIRKLREEARTESKPIFRPSPIRLQALFQVQSELAGNWNGLTLSRCQGC